MSPTRNSEDSKNRMTSTTAESGTDRMDDDKDATSAAASSTSSLHVAARHDDREEGGDDEDEDEREGSSRPAIFPGETWSATSESTLGEIAAATVQTINVITPSLPSPSSSSHGFLSSPSLSMTASAPTTGLTSRRRHQHRRPSPHDFPDEERISTGDLHPVTLRQPHVLLQSSVTNSSITDATTTRPMKNKRRRKKKKKGSRKPDPEGGQGVTRSSNPDDEADDDDESKQPDKHHSQQPCSHCRKQHSRA